MSEDTPGEDASEETTADESAPDDTPARYDRTTRHPTPGPRNSLHDWPSHRSPLVVAFNYALIWLVRVSPSLRLKRRLLSAIGVDVGEGVSWGLEATPDVFWPNYITLGDDVIVGYDATLLCHEFLQEEYRTGEVVLGDRAMIGAGAIVLPGVHVGADAQVAANSLVAHDVPPGATVAGVPAEVVSETDSDAEDVTDD
ncbi:acyltransferase [Halobium salinum]|uniref:Acyltransferase n=1 Tax=Halobium salinum TaxID=1364940 RepID=A0ABD5PDZ1_9EURY|nr:acyltransferase [Halobium salinum]